ncbi:MAG: glycine-rich protein [Bacteroidota bacterium]
MTRIKNISILIAAIAIIFSVARNGHAQGVSINAGGAPADSSAMLDVSSTSRGVLISRMTTSERNAIVHPAEGLMIFNTDSKCINLYRSNGWWEICGNCIPPASPVVGNNGPMCEGNSLNLTASLITGVTYSWTGPNGFSSTARNPVIANATSAATGTYTLTASINGCTSVPVTTTANIYPIPSAAFTFTSTGLGQNVTFTPALTGQTYSWTFQGGTPSASTLQNPVVVWNTTGSYNISLTVTTSNNCSASSSTTISVSNCVPGSTTFIYTGNIQYFTVPSCVTSITVEAYGAEGGGTSGITGTGGKGGKAIATIPVTPGETLNLFVGGMGLSAPVQIQGGYNGGGGTNASSDNTGAGGGASDIRRGLTLNDRLVVAGGGGGAGYMPQNYPSNLGGAGGGLSGGDGGTSSWCTPNCNGKGGTQSAGGLGGQRTGDPNAGDGTFGTGGRGQGSSNGGGGGGGGWYGGGGGEATSGGGGSSYISYPGSTNTSTVAGVNSGNGYIIVSW